MDTQRLFLLDGHALVYRAYYAFIKNPRFNSKGLNTSAILGFINTLEEILRKENPSHIAVCFDPKGPTFRHEAYQQYKAQREETPEGIRTALPIIQEIIKAYNIPVLIVPGYEADDVIGTLAHKACQVGYTTYMMTPDKDYGQLVNECTYIYKPKYGSNDFEIMGAPEVTAKFGIQTPTQVIDLLGLMGDSVDNIPGCPGVGEKTASKLIGEFGSIENLLAHTDQLKGALRTKIETHREQILFSKFLATIKTDVPIEFDEASLLREPINQEKLQALFSELEFRQLAERILGKTTPEATPSLRASISTAPSQPVQGSLFDLFTPEEPEAPKFSTLKQLTEVPHRYILADNQNIISELLARLEEAQLFCFDTETTHVDPIRAELVGFSIAFTPYEAYYIPVPSDRQAALSLLNPFRPHFESKATTKVGQNIKYDYLILRNYGIRLQGKLFDTMVAHYLLQPEQRHNMDYLAEHYLHYQPIPIEQLIGARGKNQRNMRDLSPLQVCDYAAEDADVTLQLKEALEPLLKKEEMEKLFWEIEMPLVPVLAEMEYCGVRVDREALQESSQALTGQITDLEEQIYTLAGERFNVSSARQVGEILFEKLQIIEKAKKTKTGQYSTTEEVLEKLRGKHPIVPLILEQRGLRKLLSTYINALPELILPQTGKIHTSFNQTVTATGRLSSSNPNLQNIPIRDEAGREIRRAFIADPGDLFLSADYSQIELRIMAHLSQDKNMIEAFLSGNDIHAATAAKIYKIPLEEVTKEMRRKAKTANFGIIYGISVFGLAERLNIPRGEAKELINGYFETYPSIKTYMDQVIAIAREKGYVETLFGRRRELPDINSHNAVVRGYAERNAINAPIQGTAADIIKIAMERIAQRMEKEQLLSRMILQVHDELNFNVPQIEAEIMRKLVIEEMEGATQLSVPLSVDCNIGQNWLEAH